METKTADGKRIRIITINLSSSSSSSSSSFSFCRRPSRRKCRKETPDSSDDDDGDDDDGDDKIADKPDDQLAYTIHWFRSSHKNPNVIGVYVKRQKTKQIDDHQNQAEYCYRKIRIFV